jgi:hypothetical protein
MSSLMMSRLATLASGSPSMAGSSGGCVTGQGLEHVRFFPRQVIGAEDLNLEHAYVAEKLRRHNRFLHGWGVVAGCQVLAAPTRDLPWQIGICPGYVITPQGDEVYVAAQALFDLESCLVKSDDPCAFSRPCPPVAYSVSSERERVVYLAVRYIECQARPVRVAPVGCGCDDAACEYSRIRDAYEFCCLDSLPDPGRDPSCDDLCAGGPFDFVDCPTNPWVVLARIRLPANAGTPIDQAVIQLARRDLYRTAWLQEMSLCQCDQSRNRDVLVATPVLAEPSASPSPSPSPEPPQ